MAEQTEQTSQYNLESSILQTLFKSAEYYNKVLPVLKPDHFPTLEYNTIFKEIQHFQSENGTKPTLKDIGLQLQSSGRVTDRLRSNSLDAFKALAREEPITNIKAFLKSTEQYVRRVQVTNAIFASSDIIKANGKFDPIIGMISEALSVSFDTDIGHLYNTGISERLEYYTRKLRGLTSGVNELDMMLGGGFMSKTLSVIVGASHSGKSAMLTSITSANLLKKKNVLFLTLEMSDLETAKRIDCNILDYDINSFKTANTEDVQKQFRAVEPLLGKLVIKEYGAGTFNTLMLETLMQELKNEKDFIPDMIVIDYLGLMSSSRGVTLSGTGNSNTVGTAIAEEVHAFAKENDIPIVSAYQLNRSAFGNVDAGMENIQGAIGVAQTADVMIMVTSTPDMKELEQTHAKIIKNRNTGQLRSLMLHADHSKMRFTDWDGDMHESAEDLSKSLPTSGIAQAIIDTGLGKMPQINGVQVPIPSQESSGISGVPPLDTSALQIKVPSASSEASQTTPVTTHMTNKDEFDFG